METALQSLRSQMAVNLNIGRGLNNKEELLIHTIRNQDCDICGVSEVDIEDFDE